jgi:putative glutamine amidotransferase
MSACAVGICAAIEEVRWGPWEEIVAMMPRSYASAVQAAGAFALLLPPDDLVGEEPDRLLDKIDALVLPGGSDLDPASYGAARHPETSGSRPERDRFELALTRCAIERELPLLGICRGMQVMNVALGGTLVQHLPDLVGHTEHRHTPGAFGDHEVTLEPGSLAARATGAERLAVKSHHHQGIADLGDGLRASGWSVPDGIVEAAELEHRPFALGVLWHPEEDQRSRVVASLVEAARAGIAAR